jgi:hypothetical protein
MLTKGNIEMHVRHQEQEEEREEQEQEEQNKKNKNKKKFATRCKVSHRKLDSVVASLIVHCHVSGLPRMLCLDVGKSCLSGSTSQPRSLERLR